MGAIGRWPHRWDTAQRNLAALGLQARLAPHAAGDHGYVAAGVRERADDLNRMFADPEIRAIIASIGGNHSCQLLSHLDPELIHRNPKVFMGYSDITVLNIAIHSQTGLLTFNGPAVVPDLGEFPALLPYTADCLVHALFEGHPTWTYRASSEWTDEFLDWDQKLDLTRPRRTVRNTGWKVIHPGVAQGRLMGGCLESLQHLRGTPYWPDWDGTLFFWELSEQRQPPSWVDAVLSDYTNMGVLMRIAGMMVGRPYGYTLDQRRILFEVIRDHTAPLRIPVVAEMDFGHTAPQFPLPVGAAAELIAELQDPRLRIHWGE
jgi:muramoyltetrapeptide carboxypeptidase